jgi:hypothetical protein
MGGSSCAVGYIAWMYRLQTWRNWDLSRMTMHELYGQFGLDVMTIDFIGHALALHQNDAYMMQVIVGGGYNFSTVVVADRMLLWAVEGCVHGTVLKPSRVHCWVPAMWLAGTTVLWVGVLAHCIPASGSLKWFCVVCSHPSQPPA